MPADDNIDLDDQEYIEMQMKEFERLRIEEEELRI